MVETPPLPEFETLFVLLSKFEFPEFELPEFVLPEFELFEFVTGLPEPFEPLMPPLLNEFLFLVTVTVFVFVAVSVP